MDIRYFFGPKKKKKTISKNEQIKISQKKLHQKGFIDNIAKMISLEVIDLLEYSHIMQFYKGGGTLVEMGRYNQIINKILTSDKVNQEAKDELANHTKFIFSHLYDIVVDDEIDITKLIEGIIFYNKDLLDFTNDQKKGINLICNFLYDPSQYTFSLRGFAGTGKTTTITKLIHYLILKNYINSVVFAAPTNKAVNVMKSKFRNDIGDLLKQKLVEDQDEEISFAEQLDLLSEKGFKIDFLTLHKLLNYKNDYDCNGNRVFIKGDKSSINNYDLVVIDECSMIPMQVIANIFEDIRNHQKRQVKDGIVKKIPKILFVGDPAQLPPVDEKVSIIFGETENDFDIDHFKKMVPQDDNYFDMNPEETVQKRLELLKKDIMGNQHFTLEHVVRSSNSRIVGLCNETRSWVMGLTKEPKVGVFKGKKVKFYKYNKKGKLKSEWFKTCLEYFSKKNKGSNIILTWTNKQGDIYNNAVRKELFKKDTLKRFEIGDILILKDFYNIEETEMNFIVKTKLKNDKNNQKKRFYTSEQIKIQDIEHTIRVSPPFSETLPLKLRRIKNFNNIEAKYSQTMRTINKNINRKYSVYKLIVIKLADAPIKGMDQEEYKIFVLKKGIGELVDADKEYTAKKIKELRNHYRSIFADRMKKIDKDIIRPLWREWGRRFIDPFANVDYGNSLSVHKSQASTFYNVFVDIDNILLNRSQNEAKICIYTAITRTSNELHLLI